MSQQTTRRPETPITEADARRVLADAQAAQGRAEQALADAEDALQRGGELLQQAESLVRERSAETADLHKRHVEHVRKWATAGQGTDPLPFIAADGIAEDAERARRDAHRQWQVTLAAHETLKAEVTDAQSAVLVAGDAVHRAAIEVARVVAEAEAARIEALEREANALRVRLASFAYNWFGLPGEARKSPTVSQRTRDLLNFAPANARMDGYDPTIAQRYRDEATAKRWQAFVESLQADADAALD